MKQGNLVPSGTGVAIALCAAALLACWNDKPPKPAPAKPSASATPAPPAFGPSVIASRTLQTSDMTTTAPLIPVDLYRPASGGPAVEDMATYAWLEFISAVAPVNPQQRGAPGGSFASSGANPSATLVWETYQHRSELFPFSTTGKGVPPQPWNAPPKYVENAGNQQYVAPFSNYNNLDEATQIGQNLLFFPVTPGSPQPATDAQVLFEAKVNQYEWAFVNQNYASLDPGSTPISLPAGTVEVKAAWRPLSSIPADQQGRYHTASVITYGGTDAAPVAQTADYALIALHIIHKSPNYPAFVFATFEQVDNLTNQATGAASGVYYVPQYNAVAYTTATTTSLPPFGKTATNPVISFNTQKPTANPNGVSTALPVGAVTSTSGVVTIPVTQPDPTASGVATVNQQALAAMQQIPGFDSNFVWQYYRLAGVQAVPTNDDATPDFYLANLVVESSQPGLQLFRGFPKIGKDGVLTNARNQTNVIDTHTGNTTSSGGCQGCHGVAQTQHGFDFSFLFFGMNGSGFSPEVLGVPTSDVAATRVVNRRYPPFQ